MGCFWFTGTQSYSGGLSQPRCPARHRARRLQGQPWSAGLPSIPTVLLPCLPPKFPKSFCTNPHPLAASTDAQSQQPTWFTLLTAASPWAREPHGQRDSRNSPEGGTVTKDDPPEQAIPKEALPILLSSHPTLVTTGLARPTQRAEGELSVLKLRVVPLRNTWPRTCPTPSKGNPNCPRDPVTPACSGKYHKFTVKFPQVNQYLIPT